MPLKHTITFAVSSVKDLEEIRAWYVDQQVPDMGERLLREVIPQIERLADFPDSGRIVPEFGVAHLREIIHPLFRIVYRLDKTRARIVRVWRSERLLKMPKAESGVEERLAALAAQGHVRLPTRKGPFRKIIPAQILEGGPVSETLIKDRR